jgi:hypothetical protein
MIAITHLQQRLPGAGDFVSMCLQCGRQSWFCLWRRPTQTGTQSFAQAEHESVSRLIHGTYWIGTLANGLLLSGFV